MLNSLTTKKKIRSFSICAENLTGEKGKGGMATEGTGAYAARELGQGWKVNPFLNCESGATITLADVKGQGAIKHIWITEVLPKGRWLILRIYFDGQEHPAVEAPLSDFFCNGDSNDYRQLSSLAICVNPAKGMNSYFEMPYFSSFRIEVENIGLKDCMLYYQIDCEEKKLPPETLYFHARFNCVRSLPYKENYTILDKVKGQGHYVGTYIRWGVKSNGWWGEGEVKFYVDGDCEFPTLCGTGTEDYFCGSCNFDVGGYREYCTPYAGLHKVSTTDAVYRSQRFFDMYRWHITDPVYFKEDLKVTVQALGWRNDGRYLPLQDEISSVAYWYSDNLSDEYVPLPCKDEFEII